MDIQPTIDSAKIPFNFSVQTWRPVGQQNRAIGVSLFHTHVRITHGIGFGDNHKSRRIRQFANIIRKRGIT